MKYFLLTLLLASFFFAACQPLDQLESGGGKEPPTINDLDSGDVLNIQGFREAMVKIGATVGEEGEVEQPFFSVPGQVITVNEESVQVFEYDDAAQAESEAAQVAPDGSSVGTSMVSWIGPPHFYQTDRIIVIYIGDNQSVIELLESVLGAQFAGVEITQLPVTSSEPPAAVLQVGEDQQVSGIGSYCWTEPGSEVGICADMIGIPTSPVPLIVGNPFTALFTFPFSDVPDSLTLYIFPLEEGDKLESEVDGLYWWSPNLEARSISHLGRPYETEVSLEPGLYLLSTGAQWQGIGDVSYGFLVEVSPAQG